MRRYSNVAARLALQPPQSGWNNVRLRVEEGAAPDEVAAAVARADQAAHGSFEFLNTRYDLGRPIDWHAAGPSQLWRYKLQYCRFIVDLAATRADSWSDVAALMREWIAANPMGRVADAWHPFVVSERLINWMLAARLCAPSSNLGDDILQSLAVQAVFIEDNLETDVGGNHLLKNLKAMLIAGCFWRGPGPNAYAQHAASVRARTRRPTALADGAHYERSPMYHSLCPGRRARSGVCHPGRRLRCSGTPRIRDPRDGGLPASHDPRRRRDRVVQ